MKRSNQTSLIGWINKKKVSNGDGKGAENIDNVTVPNELSSSNEDGTLQTQG